MVNSLGYTYTYIVYIHVAKASVHQKDSNVQMSWISVDQGGLYKININNVATRLPGIVWTSLGAGCRLLGVSLAWPHI